MEIREWVGNKNRFVDTCNELGLGLLQTYCCEPEQQFVDIERRLDPQVGYIIKPATDRTRFEDQRRRFYRLPDVAALQQFMASDVGKAMIGEEYQVQEYIDFHRANVAYYNVTFEVAEVVRPRLVTRQILNLSAIHNNCEALHWGNASVADLQAVEEGVAGCRQLVAHYHRAGYRGEIGIDFGMADGRCFFLEANARENNGTRLHTHLQALDVDAKRQGFLFMRNIPFRLMQEEKARRGESPDIAGVIDCGDRQLVLGDPQRVIAPLVALLEAMTRQQPPFPY
ncbi:hypothetical protein FFI16_002840 [Pseudomonas sp. KBS0710]|uniref:hypothetical protein n=1 Tax=Pseudomonas sp. KBS0710 TaxID=1179667 RepID=UPI00110DB6F0|nr:hypothetical protein [Pseudomonas sp. KBS0710]TSD75395.1 hypothetical protein FFI16_002840 [Pseudomonas sp. KBS0710]